MSKISYLSSEDFIVLGSKQKTLGITVQGAVLVFFKMKGCRNCAEFEPVFAKLAQTERRVSHAILDISDNRDVVVSSRETSTPIVAVPIIILYINGRPHVKFNGKKNIPSLQSFITKALQATAAAPTSSSRQQFMPAGRGRTDDGSDRRPAGGGRGKVWNPDIGTAPSMKGIIKGAGGRSGGYSHGANVEEDDEPRLLIPDSVIPHNAPWEADFVNQDM